MNRNSFLGVILLTILFGMASATAWAQGAANWTDQSSETTPFRFGVGDVLSILVWKSPELAAEVPVRPDGKITLPLVGEVEVIGMTPLETQGLLSQEFSQFVTAPAVSVVVTQINSWKIFILGEVNAPGAYDLLRPTRVMQMLAMAGGLTEWAKKDEVVILREVDGHEERRVVSAKDITAGKRPSDNILLQPGDTIIVP